MSRPVVSAEDVRAAARRGELRLAVPSDAIVTPLARDEAARRGIELIEAGTQSRSSPPQSTASPTSPSSANLVGVPSRSATCDPDDVERIVDRVRARMPGADPGQVRDIARRLLERLGG